MAQSIWYEVDIEALWQMPNITIRNWLDENSTGEWNIGVTKIWFRKEADAMFFELRWK